MKVTIRFLPYLISGFILLNTSCSVRNKTYIADGVLLQTIEKNFLYGTAQYKTMMKTLPDDRFPKMYDPKTETFQVSGSDWWCSGFYPGTLLYLYEQTKDYTLYKEAERIMKILEKEKANRTTHDLGFMMYCSFGNINRITPRPEYKEILLQSARSLATRFDPKVGCIRSWDSRKPEFLVIIDNMMNLELLFWAAKTSGDSSFYNIAVTHANTTMKNHFRSDYSSYHVVAYDPVTGAVQEKRTAQGASDESAWARGQAWGLYGYTMCYRETRNKKYLDQATHIARFIRKHLPKDGVPYWDYNAPGIPNALRDASAAAIMASAFLELGRYVPAKKAEDYTGTAKVILNTLSTDKYKPAPGTAGGFILKHSVGHFPQQSEVDVSLTYADYYFVEAMIRFKNRFVRR